MGYGWIESNRLAQQPFEVHLGGNSSQSKYFFPMRSAHLVQYFLDTHVHLSFLRQHS